ncbi:MAG: nucleoside triphosphate pyrophosphohydrolase, partial [candidate division Zixibacteria bacterium]|nr:nucleoside triphosphate pyrophosphohydrolase [candidate division Zixibacteria bacterium]
ALMMAFRMGEKAGGVGFDWHNPTEVLDKLEEETREIKQELKAGDKDRLAEEIGDLLFATASLARKLEIDPELALKKALYKFKNRFEKLEKHIKDSGRSFDDYTLGELEDIWQSLKG